MTRPENTFLRRLWDSAFALFAWQLTPFEVELGTHVQKSAIATTWVDFLEMSLLSTIVLGPKGRRVEASMVGAEVGAGLVEACGSRISAIDYIVQAAGSGWRARSSAWGALVSSSPDFEENGWRAAELQSSEARRSGLCHALHPVEKPFARWLLESMERSGDLDPLPMAQEFLSAMLGVHRTTVTGLAAKMQELGAIHYSRGQFDIVNPERLGGLACGCRRAMQDELTRLGSPVNTTLSELV